MRASFQVPFSLVAVSVLAMLAGCGCVTSSTPDGGGGTMGAAGSGAAGRGGASGGGGTDGGGSGGSDAGGRGGAGRGGTTGNAGTGGGAAGTTGASGSSGGRGGATGNAGAGGRGGAAGGQSGSTGSAGRGGSAGGGAGAGGAGGGVIACGPTKCPVGEVCCNPSCGVCTPPGGGCAGIVCDAPKYHYTCGQRICNPNQPRDGGPSTQYPPCTNEQKEGASCSSFSMICDPSDPCDRMLACQTSPSVCPF